MSIEGLEEDGVQIRRRRRPVGRELRRAGTPPNQPVGGTGWRFGDDWGRQAACKGVDPAQFFPENGRPPKEQRRPCEGCPVRDKCLEAALNAPWEPYGPWGGEPQSVVQELWAARHPRNRSNEDTVLSLLGLL